MQRSDAGGGGGVGNCSSGGSGGSGGGASATGTGNPAPSASSNTGGGGGGANSDGAPSGSQVMVDQELLLDTNFNNNDIFTNNKKMYIRRILWHISQN